MKFEDILKDIREKPVVPLIPHCSTVLRLSRGATYAAAANGEIDTVQIGRLKRAITASLRKQLKMEN